MPSSELVELAKQLVSLDEQGVRDHPFNCNANGAAARLACYRFGEGGWTRPDASR
jgi:hypothetical protein